MVGTSNKSVPEMAIDGDGIVPFFLGGRSHGEISVT